MLTRVRTSSSSPSSASSGPAVTALSGRATPGHYTDVDTLVRGARCDVRPGSYTDVDRLTRPQAGAVRPGSYVDADGFPASGAGRPGSYTDADLNVA